MQFMIEDLLTAVSAVTQLRGNSPRSSARREIEHLIPSMDSGAGCFQQIDHGNQRMFAAPGRLAESGIAATYRGEAQPRRIE
jgi:hypothetical protein